MFILIMAFGRNNSFIKPHGKMDKHDEKSHN